MGDLKNVRILGVCLVAALVFVALAAAGASAAKLPEFGACEAVPSHEGKYGDANCTLPLKKVYGKYTGGYEWYTWEHALEGRGLNQYVFKRGEIGATTFETTNGKTIQCGEGELYRSEITGPKNIGQILTYFYGCESEGQVCSSEFEEYGSITDELEWLNSEGLRGELVDVAGKKTSTPSVGLTFTSFKAGAPLFTVVCEGQLGSVRIGGPGGKKTEKTKGNTAISLISPVDQMTTQYTQTFTQTGGVQEPAATEKGKTLSLQEYLSNENKWVGLGIAGTVQYPAGREEPPTEIKATP